MIVKFRAVKKRKRPHLWRFRFVKSAVEAGHEGRPGVREVGSAIHLTTYRTGFGSEIEAELCGLKGRWFCRLPYAGGLCVLRGGGCGFLRGFGRQARL